MRKIFKNSFLLAFVSVSTFLTSCSSGDGNEIFRDNEEVEYNIIVNPNNASTNERSIEIVATPSSLVKVKVNFTGDKKMRRIYMTKNVYSSNQGPQPYEYPLGSKKSDGSIDLDGDDKDTFNYTFNFDAPTNANDVVQYIIWTTNDRGDFRDVSKRNSIANDAFGTVTIKASANADTSVNGVKSFSQVLLAAPLADGSSKTFLSLFDNKTYAINQGVEVAALWDFGYYYGNTGKASFASAANYPTDIVNVPSIGGTTELNKFYFKKSDKTTTDFDAISKKVDLDFITKPTTERVNNLSENDIIEFVDAYGNKGLIKVVKITGTNGTSGSIKFDVKVQINAEPIKA